MAETAAKTSKPRKTAAKSAARKAGTNGTTASKRSEAKSRFNAALEEARAGAALLGADAKERATAYGSQARARSDDWAAEAKTKAVGIARDGKSKATEALTGLSRVINDNAAAVDENLGPKYGEYARNASQSLQRTAERLDQKSIEDIGEDAREFVRKSPATAVGLAALAGFLLARLFRR